MSMVTAEQFEKSRHFIYRHGDLLTRRRFAYHFEHGTKQAVLDVLACYQNDDGGFGSGIELDLLCPASSGAGTTGALGYLLDLNVKNGPILERAIDWIVSNRTDSGDTVHPPVEVVEAYPHGGWWAKEQSGGILTIAGLLGRIGRNHDEISRRAATVFEQTFIPFPEEPDVYAIASAASYLRYAKGAEKYSEYRDRLEEAFPKMLEKEAWHCPLFLCHDSWGSEDIPLSVWESEGRKAVATIQDDGGVQIERYAQLPWWRPIWTLNMLVIMKSKGLLDNIR